MDSLIELSVVIPTYDRLRSLFFSLEQIARSQVFTGLRTEIVIVFDGQMPDQETVSALKKLSSGCEMVIETTGPARKGQNFARNLGVSRSRSSMLLFLDDDAYMNNSEELNSAISYLKRNRDVGVLGLTVVVDVQNDPNYGADQYYSRYPRSDFFEILYPCLAGCLVEKNRVLKGGQLFFPNIVEYGSDEWALSWRARYEGLRIMATRCSRVYHRFEQAGRDQDIRGRLLYGRATIWALYPLPIGITLVIRTILESVREPTYTLERSKYVVHGFLYGRHNRLNIVQEALGGASNKNNRVTIATKLMRVLLNRF